MRCLNSLRPGLGVLSILLFLGAATVTRTASPELSSSYERFSRMVGTVLLVRAGGIEEALKALPRLERQIDGHVILRSFFLKHKKIEEQKEANAELNKKLSDINLKLAKPLTHLTGKANKAKSPLQKHLQDEEGKINAEISKAITKALGGPATSAKVNKALTETKLNKLNLKWQATNIKNSSKISNGPKFLNKMITGLAVAEYGINFNPCLISIKPYGDYAAAFGVQFDPKLLDIKVQAATLEAYGIQVNPALLTVSPAGIADNNYGVRINPALAAISPVGFNINPAGIQISPFGLVTADSGLKVGAVGVDCKGGDGTCTLG